MKALVTANFTEEGLARLRNYMEVVYEPWGKTSKINLSDEMAEKLKGMGADVAIIETDLCHEEVLESVPLKMIGVCRGDPLNVDLEMATAKGIPVFFTPARNADAVADLTVGFMLCLCRKIIHSHNLLIAGNYNPETPKDVMRIMRELSGCELNGLTVGIVGFGAIGRGVAERLRGFRSKILAYDPFVAKEVFARFQAESAGLEDLFRRSDLVTIHAAHKDETEGMITRALIESMKPSAYFVNLARAELVDQDALYQALKEKKIAGAGIDVWSSEPPQKDDEPLLSLDNVVVAPHLGGATFDVTRHQTEMIVNDIEAYLAGKPVKHIANPEVLEKKK